jgi:opacity protein-like surface antigen
LLTIHQRLGTIMHGALVAFAWGVGMRIQSLLSAGIVLAVALSAAHAEAKPLSIGGPGAWYFGVEGGWTNLQSPQSGSASSPLVNTLSESFEDGYNIGARVGYKWGALRIEEEFRYQHNGITSITDGVPLKTFPASGTRTAFALMTNAIYDFDLGWPLTPHLGGGIGAVGQRDEWTIPSGRCDDDWNWVFGYQAIAGVRYNITPSLALDVDYRYLATAKPTFVLSGSVPAPVVGTTFDSGYSTNSIVVSLTVLLGETSGKSPR